MGVNVKTIKITIKGKRYIIFTYA